MAECQQIGELNMATENPNKDDNQFNCGICIGDYRNPRYLPTCGHTFCENCLLTYVRNIKQEAVEGHGSTFGCPVCRKPNKLPENDQMTLQWIQTFPLNTVIIKMMESLQSLPNEEMKEERRICDPCKGDGETNVGLKLCLDCKEVLCKACIKCHVKFKATKDHTLVDIGDISTEASHKDFFDGVGQCAVHPEKEVEIYCKTHDAVVCTACLISDHKTCELTELVNHSIDHIKLQNDSETLVSQMKETIEHLNLLQKLRVETKHNIKQKLKKIREHIEQMRDQVVDLMDKVVNHIREVTKQIEIEREDGLDADMARVTKLKDIAEQNMSLLNTMEQHGSEKHKFVSARLLKKEFEETGRQIAEEDRQLKQLDVELVIADNLKKIVDGPDVENLVQINMLESESSHKSLAAMPTTPSDAGAISNVLRDSRLVMVQKHKGPASASGAIYFGVNICRDGRIMLCRYIGHMLYLYNPITRAILSLSLPHPWGVAEIGDGRLAVSSPNKTTISIVTVGIEMRVEKTLQTLNQPGGIVVLSNGQVAVAWRDPPAFGVIDISGGEIVQISYMDQDTCGRKFRSFEYLAVDERRQHVIQPCCKDKAVYCFDFTGKPVFKYTDPGLTNPKGVALDRCGNIYVCECNTPGSIHKLSPTGDPISLFTKDIPAYPLAICSDIAGEGFWMTRYSLPYDNIVQYRLE